MSVLKNYPGAERWSNLRSLPVKVQRLAKSILGHWSIENQLHWMFDVTSAQDASRIRKGNGPEISSMLRKVALMIQKQDTQRKGSVTGKRKSAGWSNDTLQATPALSPPSRLNR